MANSADPDQGSAGQGLISYLAYGNWMHYFSKSIQVFAPVWKSNPFQECDKNNFIGVFSREKMSIPIKLCLLDAPCHM